MTSALTAKHPFALAGGNVLQLNEFALRTSRGSPRQGPVTLSTNHTNREGIADSLDV